MKLCSGNVLVFLLAAIMSGDVTNCNPISPIFSVEPGTQDFNEVSNNSLCPFTFKPMYVWIPKLNSKIRIVHITCKNSFIR